MASLDPGCCSPSSSQVSRHWPSLTVPDRISQLYPSVVEDETPLPRCWNPKDKSNLLGLTQNNLVVQYKGQGKNHKDAASIRSVHPIPSSCGIYYFEVKVISKGRDGYMGIGLSTSAVSLSRLPGWDKISYGYHGDDGNMFSSSGTGHPYGPTFTTGDVIGCCVNLIEGTCFYTKNGVHLGIAFRDLPPNLYPTVGLQTPGEVVEANFGQTPFVFDIEDYIQEWRQKTREKIESFPVTNKAGEWQQALQKIVSTYLVHHGYCATAEAFLRCTGQSYDEELTSIQNRQKLQSLVLAGHIGEAISQTQKLYPGLLEHNTELLFILQCRQFIEIINGTVGETAPADVRPLVRHARCTLRPCHGDRPSPVHSNSSSASSPSSNLVIDGIILQHLSTANGNASAAGTELLPPPTLVAEKNAANATNGDLHTNGGGLHAQSSVTGLVVSGSSVASSTSSNVVQQLVPAAENDVDMDTLEHDDKTVTNSNGAASVVVNTLVPAAVATGPVTSVNGTSIDHITSYSSDDSSNSDDEEDYLVAEMEVDIRHGGINSTSGATSRLGEQMSNGLLGHQLCGGNEAAVSQLVQFGRQLHQLCEQLVAERAPRSDIHRKALRDAFSLLAYSDPWNSPVGYQLSPLQREPVCTALNSAILEMHGLPKQPPLEIAIAHVSQCVKQMSKAGIPSCAFANPLDYLQ